jgi:hypothetical protein
MRCEVKLLDAVALLEDVQTEEVLLQRGEVGAVVEVLAPDVYDSWFAQILRGFEHCGRVSGAEEVRHGRDPDHS